MEWCLVSALYWWLVRRKFNIREWYRWTLRVKFRAWRCRHGKHEWVYRFIPGKPLGYHMRSCQFCPREEIRDRQIKWHNLSGYQWHLSWEEQDFRDGWDRLKSSLGAFWLTERERTELKPREKFPWLLMSINGCMKCSICGATSKVPASDSAKEAAEWFRPHLKCKPNP